MASRVDARREQQEYRPERRAFCELSLQPSLLITDCNNYVSGRFLAMARIIVTTIVCEETDCTGAERNRPVWEG